jgi:large subunit ribosomal protein L13
MQYTIDAKGRSLGRVATEAASLLMGKETPAFRRDKVSGNEITIVNAEELNLDPKKLQDKKYKTFSGYPGGLKHESMRRLKARKGVEELLRLAIYGMLPSNKLRPLMMKNIKIVK